MKSTTSLLSLLLPLGLFAQEPDLKKLDAYIADVVVKFDQPGLAVGVVKDGKLVWSQGYGKLDLARPDPVTPNSVFYMASISKAFTACAIGLLVDEGKLSFDDPVRNYLPNFKTPNDYVTEHFLIRDLLCHRSGWITFDGDLLWYGTGYTQDEILRRHSAEPTTYEFRTEFGYSNLMFIAAARVVENVSGMNWDRFITERIFGPLGMERSRVETADLAGMSDVALPHVRKGQDRHAPQKSMPYQALRGADGACGVLSTVTDLAKWDAMWASEGKVGEEVFLKPETWGEITSTTLAMGGSREGAALGWFTQTQYNEKVITHSGGMPGFILNHAVAPGKDLAVIALGNGESSCVFAVTRKVMDVFLGGKSDTDPVGRIIANSKGGLAEDSIRVAERNKAHVLKTKPSLTPSGYTGTYTDKTYGDARVTEKDGKLSLSFEPAAALFTGTLEHWHYDTFQWLHADPFLEPGYITFTFDAVHKVTGFKVDLHSPDFHFYKLDFKKQ